VINDNSSDGTERVLATLSADEIGVRYINNPPPGGFVFAVRRGLAEFRGEAIVMADGSDDSVDVIAFTESSKAATTVSLGRGSFAAGVSLIIPNSN
jgi:glycosyltransferase involved in cell wall biosynthesis